MTTFRAACVQLNSGSDVAANLETAEAAIRDAASQGAHLIMLPEYTTCLTAAAA